jgi:1,4-alpha-glucan branching enzyme
VKSDQQPTAETLLQGPAADRERLVGLVHDAPHDFLGPHRDQLGEEEGTVVRVHHPEAEGVDLVVEGKKPQPMESLGDGLFALWLPDPAASGGKKKGKKGGKTSKVTTSIDYQLTFHFADGSSWQRHDPYRFPPTLGELDLYYLSEGTHLRLWECLGARPLVHEGEEGFAFSVWAPNARQVSLVGEFCHWDGRLFPMRRLGGSGIFDLFMPGLPPGTLYKFEILTAKGERILKADPLARAAELPPGTASRTFRSTYRWGDGPYLEAAAGRDVTREPMAIYEVHLGSWLRGAERDPTEVESGPQGDRLLTYRELAPRLVEHVKRLGFNYIELLPVAEHPYDGSWGYQITGYFAPTSRHGDPDDFRFFVDHCHQNGIGVLVDWVPAHFVKDAHGLGRFDGTALYEHADPRRGEHPDWGTYIFNYGRWEVRNFLVANALYWLEELHIDGLRVDAVASMIYLDYSRKEGEWVPNAQGGRENLEALELLRLVNRTIAEHCPGRFTVAEESTAWPHITRPVDDGGLGFTLKWNMGWMHDTLGYFGVDPLFRSGCHDQLTFAMIYEHSERFINPLSHDEVVHGKGSLYTRMPGDSWRKLANLRALFAYQFTRPGKALLFMGSELASPREWNHKASLDWYLLRDPARKGLFHFLCELGALYQDLPALWRDDPDPEGFQWIACWDHQSSIFAYERRADGEDLDPPTSVGSEEEDDGDFGSLRRYRERVMVVLNLTPVPREGYRLGVLEPGDYRLLLSSDEERFGGSGYAIPELGKGEVVKSEAVPHDNCRHSVVLSLPPLAALILAPKE